jgi:hypothetical protein
MQARLTNGERSITIGVAREFHIPSDSRFHGSSYLSPRMHMARKVLNRRELRQASEAAERAGLTDEPETEEGGAKVKKAPVKRKTRAKVVKEVRLKAFWGVFNQSLKRVALFEYSERGKADKKAAEMTASQKTPHFVQQVKEAIQE